MKYWTTDEIKNLVQTNDLMLYRSLLKLYECQTADEQAVGETKIHNGVGFNATDSRILSSFAKFLMHRNFLSDKQKAIARRRMIKYTKQITNLANIHEEEKKCAQMM